MAPTDKLARVGATGNTTVAGAYRIGAGDAAAAAAAAVAAVAAALAVALAVAAGAVIANAATFAEDEEEEEDDALRRMEALLDFGDPSPRACLCRGEPERALAACAASFSATLSLARTGVCVAESPWGMAPSAPPLWLWLWSGAAPAADAGCAGATSSSLGWGEVGAMAQPVLTMTQSCGLEGLNTLRSKALARAGWLEGWAAEGPQPQPEKVSAGWNSRSNP